MTGGRYWPSTGGVIMIVIVTVLGVVMQKNSMVGCETTELSSRGTMWIVVSNSVGSRTEGVGLGMV